MPRLEQGKKAVMYSLTCEKFKFKEVIQKSADAYFSVTLLISVFLRMFI